MNAKEITGAQRPPLTMDKVRPAPVPPPPDWLPERRVCVNTLRLVE